MLLMPQASWTDKHLSDRIQPPILRAPEVTLGAPWGPSVDIWNLGCLVRLSNAIQHGQLNVNTDLRARDTSPLLPR